MVLSIYFTVRKISVLLRKIMMWKWVRLKKCIIKSHEFSPAMIFFQSNCTKNTFAEHFSCTNQFLGHSELKCKIPTWALKSIQHKKLNSKERQFLLDYTTKFYSTLQILSKYFTDKNISSLVITDICVKIFVVQWSKILFKRN